MTGMTSAVRAAAGILLAGYGAAAASDPASDIEALRQAVEQMKTEYENRIRSLEERLRAAETAARRAEAAAVKVETVRKKSALDEAVAEVEAEEQAETVAAAAPPSRALWSRRVGGADVRLLDVSLNLMGTAGTSTVGNDKGPVPKDEDTLRDRRLRVSPILSWRPTEYSRFRLQYNWDDAQYLKQNTHSVWLGFDLSYGAHPAHKY